MPYPTSEPVNDGNIAYDLRQTYAKIVGEHMLDIAYSRKQKNLPDYFSNLEDLYIIIKHKIRIKNKKGEKIETYENLKSAFITLANQYKDAYLNSQSSEAEGVGKIFNSLKQIEMYFYKKMDEAHMFGSKRDMEGLI